MRARDTQEGPRTGPRRATAGRGGDVARARERRRQRRLLRLALVLGAVLIWLAERDLSGAGLPAPSLPDIDPLYLISGGFFVALTVVLLGTSVAAGRSPHVMYRPEQIDVRHGRRQGHRRRQGGRAPVARPLPRARRPSPTQMGGTPRRGLLFEGPPGTGKTHLAKAMAAEAGVPFLVRVARTAFQSMYYGATARKIRAYFKALRKAARSEGGAIGFIEEIDAIATARGGMSAPTRDARRRARPAAACRWAAAGSPACRRSAPPGAAAALRRVVNRSRDQRGRRRRRQRAARPDAVVRQPDGAGRSRPGPVRRRRQPAAARRTGSCRGREPSRPTSC